MNFASLYRSIGSIAGAAFAAQLVIGLSAPALTRIYTAADLGGFAAFQSLAMIGAVLFTMRFEFALPNIKNNREIPRFGFLVIGTIFLLTAASCLTVVFLSFFEFSNSGVRRVMYFVPFAAAAFGIHEFIRFFLIRNNSYRAMALSGMSRSISQVLYQVLFGLLFANLLTLIISYFFSLIVAVVFMLKKIRVSDLIDVSLLKKERGRANIWALCRKYSSYPKYMMPLGLVNMAGQQLPAIFFAVFFSASVAGYFAIAQRLIGLPMSLIGKAIGDVFFGEFARLARTSSEHGAALFMGMLKRLAIIAVPVAVVPFFIPRELYEFILGAQWGMVKQTVDILSVSYAVQILVSPLAQTMIILKRERLLFFWDLTRLVCIAAICASPLAFSFSYETVLLAYSLVVAVLYLILLFIMWVQIKRLNIS